MFIRTPRLFLRPAWAEDAPAVAAAMGDWNIVKNLGRAPWPYGLADAEAYVAGAGRNPGETSFLIFVRRPDDVSALAGSIGFGRFGSGLSEPEIGYWLAREMWGQGIAMEAATAVLELVFLGLRMPRLAAGHFVDNPASGRVLQKLGFRATGETRLYPCRARGAAVDSVEYLLTAEQWHAGRSALKEAA